MKIIGLTGGIGSGKSTVSSWFIKKGVEVLDADKIAHEILANDKEIIKKIEMYFGPNVINEEGKVNRRELGKLVFSNHVARTKLENFIHPAIITKFLQKSEVLASQGIPIVIWDVPLLYETGLDKLVNEVWVVWVDPKTQFERISLRDSLPSEEIKARIEAQMPLADKTKAADVVIDNSSTWSKTEVQLEKEWIRIKEGKKWQEDIERKPDQ